MKTVFVVMHEYEWCGRDELKFLGVFTDQHDADAAVDQLRAQPGFCDWPDGFSVTECTIGEVAWTEGFATMVNILVPTKRADGFLGATAAWRPGDVYEICTVDEPADAAFSIGDSVLCVERQVGDRRHDLVATTVAERRPNNRVQPTAKGPG